jgi:predicted lysophospholipase L1 biosynthesis ABC-type transport system permease subunit
MTEEERLILQKKEEALQLYETDPSLFLDINDLVKNGFVVEGNIISLKEKVKGSSH